MHTYGTAREVETREAIVRQIEAGVKDSSQADRAASYAFRKWDNTPVDIMVTGHILKDSESCMHMHIAVGL